MVWPRLKGSAPLLTEAIFRNPGFWPHEAKLLSKVHNGVCDDYRFIDSANLGNAIGEND